MIGAGGRGLRQAMMSREIWTFFYRGEVPKKSKHRDNTLKSSVAFEKLSLQSEIVRRGG